MGQERKQRRPDNTLQRQAGECLRTSVLCHVFCSLMALPDAGVPDAGVLDAGVLTQYDEQQGRQSHPGTSGWGLVG